MTTESTPSSPMGILSVIFFLVAGVWLLAALLYSLMVLCFLRMRARNQLGSLHNEDFGRVQLCGTGYYLNLGCIFRRYARHLNLDDERPNQRFLFTRPERRAAMEAILLERNNSGGDCLPQHLKSKKNKNKKEEKVDASLEATAVDAESAPENAPAVETPDVEAGGDATLDDDQLSEDGGPICSICLGDYESLDAVFCPKTCSHQFHEECILDWLQRQSNTECPCCRVAMVTEDEVWNAVKRLRKEKRNLLRREQQKLDRQNQVEEECSETEEDLEADEEIA